MKRLIALTGTLLLLTACSGQKDIRIGTGDTGGAYYAYATNLVDAIGEDHPELTFKVLETAGSAANLRLLEENYLQMAFVQSDMLWNGGEDGNSQESEGYAAIAGLYTETCQIVVPADSDIQSVPDLYGKRVSLGEDESGVLRDARQILFSYGLGEEMLDADYLSFHESADAMVAGELDAFFCTAGAPTPAVLELSQTMPVRVLSIDDEHIGQFLSHYNGYTQYTLPAGTYVGQEEDVQTLGVRTVLVANKNLEADTVKMVTESLFAHAADVTAVTGETVDLSTAMTGVPIDFHPGAVEYYKENGIEAVADISGQTVSIHGE